MIKLIIDGECVPQARPRFSRHRVYDTEKCREYKEYVRWSALQQVHCDIIGGPVSFSLTVYRSIPKSFSKKERLAAISGKILPITKPDTDNYIKGVKDALKGIVWFDDAQVTDERCSKRYAEKPYIYIEVEEVGEIANNERLIGITA
ncbi:RusA family crossover junction endodeoxyribonuclease [Pectinatus frisingensis]|uniref:RusA family crossover junction endodeoxyribonuclease n=1 Tax=Pectinatus frisingensis TaxID=865 RepID=UPI0018C6F147|nr:RusA family crossover junction endodeoxyribonuclease [Pectinatus frisingensis]